MCKKSCFYLVFSFLALGVTAIPSLAEVVGVGQVVMDGTMLISATTADGYTVSVEQLRNGTTTAPGGDGAEYPPEWADDFDFSDAASNIYPLTTELFGGKNWINTNGDAPDFFIFEAAGSRQVTDFRALFPDDSVGEPLIVQTAEWLDTGVNGAFDQTIAGIAFSITDLKDTEGNNLPGLAEIKGIVTGQSDTGVDPVIIAAVVGKIVVAYGPIPPDGAVHEDVWVTLSWSPGDFAVSHDVYLGDHLTEVEEAARGSDVFRGNQLSTFYIAGFPGYAYSEGLVPGTTYYWRIDEVNEADPNSPWKGDIWSFSIPPKTAYNPDPADGAEFVGPEDVTLSWTPGFGAKLHTVYLGDNDDEVSNAVGGVPVGIASYEPGPLELERVYYWRVDESDGVATYQGDIWAFTTPGAAGSLQPANGAVDVDHTQILTWTPAENAASHDVYFGLDKEAVMKATTASPEYVDSKARGSESHDPGQLDWHMSYYWRVDAVYATQTVKGLVWSFTTADFLVVDDFESYTDDDAAGQAIWQTWIDGFGVADNGAQVGYLLPPYAEQTNVHGGAQSMPLLYVNEAGVGNSEATLPLSAQRDWTAEGVGELSLWFRGDSANATEPLYVAIVNAAGAPAVVAHGDANAAMAGMWTEWIIPLQTFAGKGINLTDVANLAIGVGDKGGAATGGSGTILIDDIRLYRP